MNNKIPLWREKTFAKALYFLFSILFSRYRRWGTRVSRPGPVAWVQDDQLRCPRRRRRVPRRPRPPRAPCRVPRPPVPAGALGSTSSSRISTCPTSSPRICCTPTGNKDLPRPSISVPRRVCIHDNCVPLICHAFVVWWVTRRDLIICFWIKNNKNKKKSPNKNTVKISLITLV